MAWVMVLMQWAAPAEEAKSSAEEWLDNYEGGHVVYAAESLYEFPHPAQTVLMKWDEEAESS